MNKKGFSLLELLAVLVIISVLSGGVVIGVSRYRVTVKEKELINLHSTIETGYDVYRSNLILKGQTPHSEIDLCETGDLLFDISYNGNKLKCDSDDETTKIKTSSVKTKIKGDLLSDSTINDEYKKDRTTYDDYIEDGTCMIISEKAKDEKTGKDYLKKTCEMENNEPVPSREEIICIYLETEKEVLINDYDKNGNNICKYFGE